MEKWRKGRNINENLFTAIVDEKKFLWTLLWRGKVIHLSFSTFPQNLVDFDSISLLSFLHL